MSTLTIFNLITSDDYTASASDWIAIAEAQVQRCHFENAADYAVEKYENGEFIIQQCLLENETVVQLFSISR